MNLRALLSKNYINLRGWKSNRKIVVIESDDWGSVRMRSKETYKKLLSLGIPVNKSYFTKNDSLESNTDLWELQNVLSKFKDINNRHPIITLNCVVANPDFEKIKLNNYKSYFLENIKETYTNNLFDSSKVLSTYQDCLSQNQFFKPQFHGREHLNVRKFMNNLCNNSEYDITGVDEKCLLGLTKGEQIKSTSFYHHENYMAGFEVLDKKHEQEIEQIAREGFQMFYELFGFNSKSFVAQSLIWGNHLLEVLQENKVEYIQGAQQFIPTRNGKLVLVNNFTGNKTKYNQILSRRNASFEPSSNPNLNWTEKCLKEIEIAFRWKTPAIINSHRVNFIGTINKENRDNSLLQFMELISSILKKWPDIEFFTSDELGDMIKNKK